MMARLRWLGVALVEAAACTQIAGIERAQITVSQSCASDADCDDKEPCTADSCDGGLCKHEPQADGPLPAMLQTPGSCHRIDCAGGQSQTVEDDGNAPAGTSQCDQGGCAGGMPTHAPLPLDAACSDNGGRYCDGKGSCVGCNRDAECNKPDVCGAIKANQCGCKASVSCFSPVMLTCGYAVDPTCGAIDCNQNKRAGQETDVDCGGPVQFCSTRCNAGKKCLVDTDCASGKCDPTGKTCA